ncbi:mitochondrial outer membrane import complex protein METAXIN isoform X1 [Rosa chinensis]|nr:mitochondrial outer membrane import complex protein METAXIN isoform X1 [Rosa chinensis]
MEDYSLVVRKPCFGLPTACPSCLPVYFYLKFADIPFKLDYNLTYPDSDKIPYVESGEYVAYNNEKGGVIETLKQDGIVDLDTEFHSVPEWIPMNAMVNSWLADAIKYELWVGTDGTSAQSIYCSDLPWPIGKILFLKQVYNVKKQLGITKDNAEEMEDQIYKRASSAFGALSSTLVDQMFLYGNRPSSLDAVFLSQALITLQALPETSILHNKLLEHENLVGYANRTKMALLDAGTSSSVPNFHANPSSSAPRKGPSNWRSKPMTKTKRGKTKEEDFKRRAKYVFIAQLIAVVLYVTLMDQTDGFDVEDDDEDFDYNE